MQKKKFSKEIFTTSNSSLHHVKCTSFHLKLRNVERGYLDGGPSDNRDEVDLAQPTLDEVYELAMVGRPVNGGPVAVMKQVLKTM